MHHKYQTIVYFTHNSLYHIIIPVGQKFIYTKLTMPLNSLEMPEIYVMALEDSD